MPIKLKYRLSSAITIAQPACAIVGIVGALAVVIPRYVTGLASFFYMFVICYLIALPFLSIYYKFKYPSSILLEEEEIIVSNRLGKERKESTSNLLGIEQTKSSGLQWIITFQFREGPDVCAFASWGEISKIKQYANSKNITFF